MVTWRFKFTTIQIPTTQILMRVSRGHISKYNLKLKKIKTCHHEKSYKDYDGKKNWNKND